MAATHRALLGILREIVKAVSLGFFFGMIYALQGLLTRGQTFYDAWLDLDVEGPETFWPDRDPEELAEVSPRTGQTQSRLMLISDYRTTPPVGEYSQIDQVSLRGSLKNVVALRWPQAIVESLLIAGQASLREVVGIAVILNDQPDRCAGRGTIVRGSGSQRNGTGAFFKR